MKNNLNIISCEIFYVLTGAIIIFALMESVEPDIVLAYLDLNWLLIFWLIVGIFILINNKKSDP